MAHRQPATVSISINGGTPNVSDDDVVYNSVVVIENTDNSNIEEYTWRILSKPSSSSASLTSTLWRQTESDYYTNVETTAEVLTSTSVLLPIQANNITSVKVSGSDTNYYLQTSYIYSDAQTIKGLSSLPGGTTEVIVVFSPKNPATSFTADAYGTFIVEVEFNSHIKSTVGACVRSPYLNMRIPANNEKSEFEGWGTAISDALISLEDGYNTVASISGSGVVGGDLSGSLPNPSVVKIQGRAISSTAPSIGYGLVWSGSNWAPASVSASGTAGGDLSGTYPNPIVAKLQGRTIDSSPPTSTYVLAWDGTKWTPTSPGTPGAHNTSHQDGGPDEISVAGLSGVLADAQNANKLQNRDVASTAPSSGQVLTWGGSNWAPAAPSSGSHTIGGSQHIADTLASFNTKISDANVIATTTSAGGDLSGTYPDPSVVKLQGRTLDSAIPSSSDVLAWDGSKWTPTSPGGAPSGAAGGDLSGTYPNPTVAKLQGYNVSSSAPTDGYVLTWRSYTSQWEPRVVSGGGGTLDHYLMFSDDTEFTEFGTSSLVKKTFRLVIPTGRVPDQWLVVISLWTTSGSDTAECIAEVGSTDSVTLTTTNSSETILQQTITVTESAGSLLTVNFKLRVTTGTDTAHLKYTDLYAIHT